MIQKAVLLEAVCRARCMGRKRAFLWGQAYWIRPAFIGSFGDGLKPMWFEPMDTRPDYYVLLADSSWGESNSDPNPFCEHLDEVMDRIEATFGCHEDEYEHDNGRTYTKHWPFPALDFGNGCACWGILEFNL